MMIPNNVLAVVGIAAAATGGIVVRGYSDIRRERDDLHRQLHIDDLGLPNRRAFNRELRGRAGPGETYTIALLDLERFKSINDAFGHDVGDWVLRHVARRITEAASPSGFVARLHGDEFAMLLPAMSAERASERAWEIREQASGLLVVLGHPIFPWTTVGMAVSAAREAPGNVLRRADAAMYRAKRTEAGVAVFDPVLDVLPSQGARPRTRRRDMARQPAVRHRRNAQAA